MKKRPRLALASAASPPSSSDDTDGSGGSGSGNGGGTSLWGSLPSMERLVALGYGGLRVRWCFCVVVGGVEGCLVLTQAYMMNTHAH